VSFQDDIARFAVMALDREQRVLEALVGAAYDSVVYGSAATGSPGQPVGTGEPGGHMRESWNIRQSKFTAHVFTRDPGAPTIELGARLGKNLILHSTVGGFHSVALTRAGFPQLVDQALAEAGHLEDSGEGL